MHQLLIRLITTVLLGGLMLAARAQGIEPAVQPVHLLPGEHIVLDGTLSHPAWQRAPVFDRFVEFFPVNGAAPPQRTSVQVLFDEQALYIGVIAYDDAPARIVDTPVRHDGVIRTQDFVVAYVDAIGSKRSAQWFRVNAAGSKADGLHAAADDSEDFAPDFDWDAAAARRADGWSAVLRLPFATLRFDQAATGAADGGASATAGTAQPWRFMLARRLPREQFHLLMSVDLPPGAPSFIDRLQPLAGVALPAHPSFLTLRPSLTLRQTREQAAGGSGSGGAARSTSQAAEASLDLKWRPRAELVVDGTLNPDFSQIDLDVPQLAGNARFALSFSEKRPFFFESADLWRSPTVALYTRSLTQPRWGLRGTWRSLQWAGTAITVQDRGGGFVLLPDAYGTGAAEQPGSGLVAARARRDDGELHWGGLVAARRYDDDRGENTVLGPDFGWHINDDWRLEGQLLASRTSAQPDAQGRLARGPVVDGQRAYAQLVRQTASAETRLTLDSSSHGFRHDTGFVNQVGVTTAKAWQGLTWRPVGPFNEFTLNVEAVDTRERDSGRLVQRYLRPGLYATGASNLEWWFELYPHVATRTSAAAASPTLVEHYLLTGLVYSPASWWPLLNTELTWGRLADAAANRVRPGARWTFSSKFRPLRSLEVEPSVSMAWLRREDGGGLTYREAAPQLLAVWHLDARHSLRAIAQRASLDRRAEPAGVAAEQSRSRIESLTYAWRRSTGTVLYVGATRAAASDGSRTTEAFVKLQVDLGEVRDAWH
ncbi:MAG: hypothetical protein IPG93_19570 [Burkholderiales bacterium]|nr:hypothetical protein [Burkholderiales bacterium]